MKDLSNKEYPDKKTAEEILAEASSHNLGPWTEHSSNVALCAERIAWLAVWTAKKLTY